MARRTKRQLKLVGLAMLFFMLMNFTLIKRVLQYKDQTIDIKHQISEMSPTILIWRPPFNLKNDYRADSNVCGQAIHCRVTYNRSSLEKSDAIVFHYKSLSKDTMPAVRRPDQLYVWWSGEKNHEAALSEYNEFFNLTFTYRRDSGVYAPYGTTGVILDELRAKKELDIDALMKLKRKSRKLAAWAVSNCSVHRRMKLAKELISAGLDLDTFGACFDNRQLGEGQNTESFYKALSEYKFYLAFENGYHCKDYITEKFWYNGLRAGTVPVVWGPKKEDVEAVAPKYSFIHVEDFKSTDDLVQYLIHLSTNEDEYRKYLAWRTQPNYRERAERYGKKGELLSFCKLCQIILERREIPKERRQMLTVPSLREWWWGGENKECIKGQYLDLEMPQDGVERFLKARGIQLVS